MRFTPKEINWIKQINSMNNEDLEQEIKSKEIEIHNLELQLFCHKLIKKNQEQNKIINGLISFIHCQEMGE